MFIEIKILCGPSESSVSVNVTSAATLTSAWIEWNNVNESMLGSGPNWYITKTGSGNFTFMVYGNDSYENYSYSELRTITLNFTNIDISLTFLYSKSCLERVVSQLLHQVITL